MGLKAMGMFPRFIHSLVIASGCGAVTVLGSLCAFNPAAEASMITFAISDTVLVAGASDLPKFVLYQNGHPPVDAGQPGGGTTGAGTR